MRIRTLRNRKIERILQNRKGAVSQPISLFSTSFRKSGSTPEFRSWLCRKPRPSRSRAGRNPALGRAASGGGCGRIAPKDRIALRSIRYAPRRAARAADSRRRRPTRCVRADLRRLHPQAASAFNRTFADYIPASNGSFRRRTRHCGRRISGRSRRCSDAPAPKIFAPSARNARAHSWFDLRRQAVFAPIRTG